MRFKPNSYLVNLESIILIRPARNVINIKDIILFHLMLLAAVRQIPP